MTAKRGKGLLAPWMNIPPEHEEEFNNWYNTEHLPERVGIEGFTNARRYVSLSGEPKYFTFYELKDHHVIYSDAYQKAWKNPTDWTKKMEKLFQNFQRNIYEEIFSAGRLEKGFAEYILTVRTDVDPKVEEEFNDWYNKDHIPALVEVEGINWARRYKIVEGKPRYLAIYDLENPDVLQTKEFEEARDAGRTSKIMPHLKDPTINVGRRIFVLEK